MSSQVKSRSFIKRLPGAGPLVGYWGLVVGGEMERKRDMRWNESSSPAGTSASRTSAGGPIWRCRCYLTLLELCHRQEGLLPRLDTAGPAPREILLPVQKLFHWIQTWLWQFSTFRGRWLPTCRIESFRPQLCISTSLLSRGTVESNRQASRRSGNRRRRLNYRAEVEAEARRRARRRKTLR